jgi:hypothetical protein
VSHIDKNDRATAGEIPGLNRICARVGGAMMITQMTQMRVGKEAVDTGRLRRADWSRTV